MAGENHFDRDVRFRGAVTHEAGGTFGGVHAFTGANTHTGIESFSSLQVAAAGVLTKTAAYTLVAADTGRHFDNTGDADSLTFTLPAVASSVGFVAHFHQVADTEIVISAPSGTLVGPNNAGRSTYTSAASGQRIGTDITAFCNGAKWFLNVDVKGLTLGTFA